MFYQLFGNLISFRTCKTDAESKDFHAYKAFIIDTVNKYYDFDDFANPVKQYLNRLDVTEAEGNGYTSHYFYVRENEVIYLNGTTETFYDAYAGFEYQ